MRTKHDGCFLLLQLLLLQKWLRNCYYMARLHEETITDRVCHRFFQSVIERAAAAVVIVFATAIVVGQDGQLQQTAHRGFAVPNIARFAKQFGRQGSHVVVIVVRVKRRRRNRW